MSQIKIMKKLGKGAYGKVYSCTDNNQKEMAVKCISIENNSGIPCIIEPILMRSIEHPNINKAINIYFNQHKLYLFQELAKSDLLDWILTNVKNTDTTHIKKWLFDILQGMYCLHKNKIIHGDLKASNILLFPDNNVKITDFTLSSIMGWKNNHMISTSTHRAPEVWLGQEWDESVDIWSLGCTFFELVYKNNIFPYQGSSSEDAYINCIIDWNKFNPEDNYNASINKSNIKYKTYFLPKDFDLQHPLNKIIMKMLRYEPSSRITIKDILEDDFFGKTELSSYRILEIPSKELNPEYKEQFKIIINDHNLPNSQRLLDLSYNMFCKLYKYKTISEQNKIITCLWISYKLIHGYPPYIHNDIKNILVYEKLICNYLSFRLISFK